MSTPETSYVCSRFVALVDILGFRYLRSTMPVIEVVKRVDAVLKKAKIRLEAQVGTGSDAWIRTLEEFHFSDTILICSPPIKLRILAARVF